MSDAAQPAAIEVHLKFFPLAFLLYLFKPRLAVDGGEPVVASWGSARIPVAPGRHQLRAFVPYLFFRFMGDATTLVDVLPGQVVHATWSAPWLVFLPGSWRLAVDGPACAAPVGAGSAQPMMAAAAPAAAWHPDPTNRHQLRYWDGLTWTAHVSDAGVAATDPTGARRGSSRAGARAAGRHSGYRRSRSASPGRSGSAWPWPWPSSPTPACTGRCRARSASSA